MADVVVLMQAALHAWAAFREELLPMREIEKIWPEFQAAGADLPDREQSNQEELLALVQEMLDSSAERRAGILAESRTELKILLAFRLLRAGDSLKYMATSNSGVHLPPEAQEPDSVRFLFRELMLRP